ncbi:hypothetical protein ZTR_02840 [Talaromyces verruculosus]|nr:hypothetical protein ZTR_02840 [Talaromyces verruculosus]
MVFKALMGGGSRDDLSSRGSVRRKSSTTGGDDSGRTSSSRRQSKISSASSVSSSRRSTRGDDRDRGLGDISASRSVTGDSTTTYVTAEPASYVDEPLIIERTPRSDRDDRQRSSRDSGDRDSRRKSEKKYSEERSSRDGTSGRDRARPRAQSGDTAAHFAAEIANPGFNQFPMQYDSSNIPGTSAPYHSPLDPHITQQFPGQLPDTTTQPYIPPNPAGFAADYYNDQGQSVAHQPGVRPQAPDIIIGAEPHLQAASPMANPPPEPSSLGQVGAAAEYYAGGDSFATSSTPTSKPPKPSKPSSSRPPKPTSGSSIAAESATFGIGSELMNQASANYPTTSGGQSRPPMQATGGSSSSHNGVGLALGGAAAGAAAAYMISHHSEQSNSNAQYNNHHNESYGIGIPTNGNFQQSPYHGNPSPYVQSGYANRPPSGPSYPSGGMQPGSLAYHQKHHGPLAAFVDFWRDPEGVGKFEDYTEAIGVCKYCFEPGTTSLNAPRKHHYDRRRRSPVVDRHGSSSRVNKLTRYNSSEDESRRKKSKGSSWLAGGLAGGLAGYVAKSLFSSKDFEDTYSVRSGTRVESSRRHTYDDESMVSSSKASSTSRGVISKKRSSDDKHSASKESKSYRYSRRSSRSRSRSTSRDRRASSGLKEAAIGAAVGTALTAAATRSSERNRSQDRSSQRHRRRQSDSSGSVNFERSRRRGRSSPRGFKSFFTAPSANRRKKSSRKERGFFSFGNSSSSSGDFDLAFGGSELFGSTVSARSSRSSKSSRKQNVDAEILGLGIAARQLAHSSSRKELTPRDLVRPPNYGGPSKVEDEEWEDAESSDSAISTNLAYGGSAIFGSSESVTSGTSFWPWSSSSRKQKKAQRQNSQPPPTNDYPYYPNDYASQDGSSGRGSLQQVVPIPTSDPTRFDVVRMSTSSSPNVQPPLVRPGPIPLQQPQPFTPVSQSVYYPTVTAPIDPLVQRIDLEDNSSRDIRRQRRSNSSPVLPMVPLDEPSPGILKRRSTAKDAGTVSFNLTEEQTDRQQEVDRLDKERRERRRKEEFALLHEEADELAKLERRRLDRDRAREERRRREEAEAEEAAHKARRERRRKEAKIDDRPSVLSNGERSEVLENVTKKTDERKEPSSSSWVTPAIVGAGAAVVAGALAEKAFEDDRSSASTSRHEERRQKRRSERRSASESQSEVTGVPRQVPSQPVVEDDEHKEKEQRIARIAASRILQNQSPTAHESYEDFFTPDDIRHHDNHEDSSPHIIEIVPRSEQRVEPYLGSDLDKPDPSWPPLVINIIKPTPPGSYDGSVRDAHSPVPTTPEPVEKEEPKEGEVEPTPVRPTTGSRVSWGEHQFHEYEVETPLSDREEHFEESDHHDAAASPEFHEIEKSYEAFVEEKPVSREVDEIESNSKHSMPGSFDDDVEFAATLAAGAEIAGFDATVVTDDASYYGKDHLSKFKDTYRPPAVESVTDLGDTVSVQSGSARKEFRAPETFDLEDAPIDEIKASKDGQTGTRSIAVTEPEDVTMSETLDRKSTKELHDDTGDSVPSSPVREERKKSKKKRRSRTLDDLEIESEERLSRRSASSDYSDSKRQEKSDDVDFEPTLKRVESAPVTDDWIEEDKERRHRKSKHSSSDRTESLDGARSVAVSAPGADELEEYRSRRSSLRFKDDDGELEDDSRSLPDVDDDGEKRRRRKHKRHSGNFDDAASVVSSPAKIDETREKRRSRESSTASTQRSKEPEKKSGGLFSSIFGSKTNLERSSSTSGKRETQSEIGVDDSTSERRRKKKSSSRRTLSGDGLEGWDAASEAAQSNTDLSQLGKALDGEDGDNDSQSSRRKRREQKRRDKYEDIVDSARDASVKDRFSTADDNDDDKKSFLGIRPEMPLVNSYEDSTRDLVGGASGLAISTTGALGPGSMSIEDQLQDVNQRLRSRSVSPSMAEKTFELAPRSQSRPSSPGGSNQEEKELRARRLSLLRTSDSPTAVPLHFKKPPTSPNSSRRVSMVSPAQSPISPRPGHRRPNSVEFKNVREIRPLWLVERHSTSKLDVEPEGPLPSLPSSKTSSRSPSVENLREGFDDGEDAVTGFFMGGGDSAYSWGRKPVDLHISTNQLPAEEDDFLNSQQATPTAETYTNKEKQFGPPPIKKEKPKYEFHSPSELLQDPTTYQSMVPELPESLDRLPSVAGSELGGRESEMRVEEAPVVESAREVDAKHEDRPKEHKSGLSSFLAGAGFASVVDAAVSAAVSDREQAAKDVDKHEATSKELTEDTIKGQAPTPSKPKNFRGFGNVVDAAVSAAVSAHTSHDVVDADRDQSMKADEDIAREHAHSSNTGLFAGVVDAAVAAAAGETPAEALQPDLSKDINLQTATQEQKAEEIPPVKDESKAVTDTEASFGTSKKQKGKDKKKKKKSKDLDAPAEDNDEGEKTTATVPAVELDSSVQPEPVPDAEAEAKRAAEPSDDPLTVTEQQPISEEVEVEDNALEISNDQSLAAETQEVAEDTAREIEAPTPNVEIELSPKAVTASAENEQTTAGTNDQPPHVAAEPEDEGSSSVAATASKSSKKKKRNKKKSLSLSETPVAETHVALSYEPQIDPSVTITEEPKSIDEVVEEKPVLEDSSVSMPSEILETAGDVAASEEKQQDKVEPEVSVSLAKSAADEGDFVIVEQDAQVTPGTEQNESLDSPVDEWFDSAETAEVQPTGSVEVAQEATDKGIQTPEVSQETTDIPEPVETKPTADEPVTTSSSKKKTKKKKKKGQSLSIDESAPQESVQEPSEIVQPQPETTEAPSLDSEVVQAGDFEGQSRDVEEVGPEPTESLPVEVEEFAPKTDDASPAVVAEGEPTTEVSEAVNESEPAPERTEEAVEPRTADAPIESVATETTQSDADVISPEQSTKEIEAAEATPTQEVFEEVPSTPSKSKKKKGKKGKRVSWAEGADLAIESEPATPAEPETSAFEEAAPAVNSEEALRATEEAVVPTSTEPESFTTAEVETPREVEAAVQTLGETVGSATPSSPDADSLLTSEPSSTTEVAEKKPSTESQPEQQLEDQSISLPSESSQSNDAKELPEEEAEQSEGATSKSKKKKDKKKDKKKKKAAEASGLADEEPSQPSETSVDEAAKEVVEDISPEVSEPIEATPAEQPVTEEQTADVIPAETAESQTLKVSEPIESTPLEQPTTEQETTDIVPAEAPEPAAPETLEPTEPIPVDQSTAEEQTSAPLPEDSLEPSVPEVTADEPNSTDIAQEEEEPQETSKSKKKKDKKKKKAAAAAAAVLSLDEETSVPPVTEEIKEPVETVVSDNAEKAKGAVVEESQPDDAKEDAVEEPVAEPQTSEEPIEKSVEEPVQEPISEPAQETVQEPLEVPVEESVQEPAPEPVEKTKPADPTDDVPTQETSKSKKKKDKKKKKAAEALLQKEEPLPKDEITDSTPATPAEAPEQIESTPQEQQLPEGEKTEQVIAAGIEEPQPVEIPVEVPAEEVKTPEVAEDDEWSQEASKSKKKKDKKKKKAAAALSLDEEPNPSEPIVEEAEAKPAEAEASEPQEQPTLDDTTKEITEDQTAEPQIAEPLAGEVTLVDNTEDDGPAQETSSKSKKKKDKKKKKAAEALPWDDEPQTPVKEEVAEPVEAALPEAQELPAMEEQKAEDVPEDKGVEPESTEPSAEVAQTESQDLPAPEESKLEDAPIDKDVVPKTTETPAEDANSVPVAAEDEWAQETSSKSRKKKDKKKKKAAEALPWDEKPTPPDKPIDEQPPADTEPSTPQAQEDTIVDDKKPDGTTEAPDAETQIPETPAEETKQVDTPEDDSWSQETSKSKKKKDKKKRKSLQLEATQEKSASDVAAEEAKDIPEITPVTEPTPATEKVTEVVDEQKEADTQSQAVSQEDSALVQAESVEPAQAENIEDEGSTSKSSKSKKKNKKNKSKDEPMPWDEESSVKTPDVQQETVVAISEDVPNEESTHESETPPTVESTEQEKQESEQTAEVIPRGEVLPQVETPEPTELPEAEQHQLPTDESMPVQPEESESANQDSLNATDLSEPQPVADIRETTDAMEQSPTDVPTSTITEEATTKDDVSSQAKSGKKSKKKKKRDSMPWDDEPAEQQESSTAPITVEGDEIALKDSQSEEKQPEAAPSDELQSQQEPVMEESKDLDSVDVNVDPENEEAKTAVTEPTRQLSAKEKRKEKKKQKRRTLDLADEPSPAVADDTPEVAAPVETPMPDEQQKDDGAAADDFAPVGKKKGKKNKRQSVSWEEEVIQAVAEEEPKSNETEQAIEESDSKIPALSKDLDSEPSQTENELQETPVEVEGKETFQSSEETHTDQREKDFDWTDNVVSPQVQSQTEESPFPVRSPISDERDDPDQSRPTTTVDDSQSHETVIPEAVAEDQLPAAVQQDGPTKLATADAQPVDQEAEDIDWTASKSSKKNKKNKKPTSITTVPEESMIIEEESSSKTPVEQDDKPDFEPKAIDTDEPKEVHEEPAVVEDSSLIPESVPLQTVDTEQPREIQEEPAPVEEVPFVSEPAPAMEANPEEEFKPGGSSKKKGKKNKKKANAWSFEELDEEPVGDQNTEQVPIQPPGNEVKKEIVAVDNDKNEVPEEAPLAPEPVQEEVVEDTTTKDATVISEEMPEEKIVPQEEVPETETAPISEPPSRKLSKKEKRKMKKGKKIEFEEEPAAETVEKEPETVSSEQVPEAAEEKVVSEPVIDDTRILDEKPVETEPAVEDISITAEEQQVADVNPVDTEPIPKEVPITTEEQPAEIADTRLAEPVVEESSTTIEEQQVADVKPAEPVFEEPSISTEEQVAEKELEIAPVQEEPVVHVSLDPFDMPDAEDEDPDEPPADFAIDTDVTERDSGPKLDADAALRARQLEQEADLAVAASLLGGSAEPEPEHIVSRQSSKKQKSKEGKKDKKNAQLEKEVVKDIAPASQTETIPKEEVVQEERHDTKPSDSVEEITRSWPSVEFDNDLSRTYSRDKNVPNELELERPIEISAQDTASMIEEFQAEETHEQSTRSISDNQVVDVGKASQQGHRSHSPSQKEDVDMIISATMAAAGFFPSTVTAPAEPKAITDIQSTSGTSRDLSDVYEHRDVFSDAHSKSSITTFDTPKGESKTNKLADIFPGLERVRYRKPSPKPHEQQTTNVLAVEERSLPTVTPVKSLKKTQATHHLSSRELPVTVESTSKDRSSSLLFDSSPSTRLEPTPDTTRRTSSSPIRLQHQTSSGSLHRTQSIHGHHTGAARSWQLEDELTPTKRTSSQSPQPPLRSGNLEGLSPPRTPLDPIKEHDGLRLPSPSPRLVMGEGPYKLERPDSRGSVRSSRSLRKANRSISGDLRAVAAASQATGPPSNPDWPSADADRDGHKKGKAGRQEVGHLPQPPNQADSFHDDLLHDNNHDGHDDYDRRHLENIPSSSSYDPVTDKGKRPVRGMSDVYEGWGETPNSPRSPTRPPSVRRRQSMQHLQELETRLDQLISENRLLAAAKDEAEQRLSRVGIARRKSDQALNTSNADLRDKEAEIARLTRSLEWMQSEVQRLTSENEAVNAKHAELTASHAREVDALRTRQLELASGMEGIVREQISAALAEKDAELRRLRDELAAARQAVQELQQQIVAATADDVLSIHDEDYFDNACQRLCQHVQQWVLRFSKHSDLRRCRPLSEVRDTKVADRFDNAILDGTDIDVILADRVRRRDVFVAVVMAMIWEYVFTRYLFGMDRDQRQKLKALEKQLSEIGPRRAVAHWRALTLTLLAKRPSFADQRVRDTEAVALEIMETLSQLLPPPQSAQSQLLESLRGVLRRAANLSIEMRTQRAEYVMLPPLQPEYDSQGDLARQVSFNASLMNERSGIYHSNETLESQGTPVRLVLFPLVVKKGNDLGDGDEEIVVCPAQVLVAWPENEKPRDRMSALGNRSVSSVVPSVDMGNMI